MRTLRENIRRALRAESTADFMRLHRMLQAEKAWPKARPAIARLFEIVASLQADQAVNCSRLAAELHTSRKTIHRDITFLRKFLAAPLRYDAARFTYVLTGPFELKPSSLRRQLKETA